MKVKTIKTHQNEFGDSYHKSGSAGPVYEVSDDEAVRLIELGYVEKSDGGNARAARPGTGA